MFLFFSAKNMILETFRGTFLLRNPTLHVSFGGGRWCPKPIKSNIALRRHAFRVVRCDDELLDFDGFCRLQTFKRFLVMSYGEKTFKQCLHITVSVEELVLRYVQPS